VGLQKRRQNGLIFKGSHRERRLLYDVAVNIRFTSTLTAEDENAVAPAVLAAVSNLLKLLPIAYTLRIDTVDGRVFQQHGATAVAPEARHVLLAEPAAATFES
jgi:hypothetical protein